MNDRYIKLEVGKTYMVTKDNTMVEVEQPTPRIDMSAEAMKQVNDAISYIAMIAVDGRFNRSVEENLAHLEDMHLNLPIGIMNHIHDLTIKLGEIEPSF